MTHDRFDDLLRARINRRAALRGAAGLGVGAAALGGTGLRRLTSARQEKTPVTFWTTHVDPDLTVLKAIVASFNAENPDIEVTLTQLPPAEVTDVAKLMTAVRGGTGPDVYMLDRFIVAQRAADGLLTDLTDYLQGADLAETHVPFAAAEAQFDGGTYALPFDTDVRALYYNKGMLQEGGIDPAELDPANGPITYARLKEIAFALNKTEGDAYTQMGFVPYYNQGWHYGYGFSFGGDFFDEEACQVTPDDPKVVQAFQWVYDYAAEADPQKMQNFIQAAMKPGTPPQESPFIQGRLAMMLTGDWQIAQQPKYAPDMDYGITYIPVPEEGMESETWAGGWSMVMPEGAKEPEAAWTFMQYIAGEPGQRVYAKDTAHLPTILTLLEDKTLFDERHRFFSDELIPTANNRPPLPVGALYWDQLTDAWQKVYRNEEEPAEALAAVKETVQAQMDQFC